MSQFARSHPEFDGDYLDYHSDLADMRDKGDGGWVVKLPPRCKRCGDTGEIDRELMPQKNGVAVSVEACPDCRGVNRS